MDDREEERVPTVPERLGVVVKETQAVLHQRMDEELRPLGLSVPQYVCLQNLNDAPGVTGSELARRTFVSRQSMNVLLRGLEKRGLIDRAEEPGPRRERAATITSSGLALLDRAHGAVGGVADLMTSSLTSADRDLLLALLSSCRDALLGGGGRR